MLALSLVSLCVFIFSAYAYGATTVLALRQVPLWGRERRSRAAHDPVVLILCGVSTIWFVLHAVAEFGVLVGRERWHGTTDIITVILSFSFPPLIMHNVLHESTGICEDPVRLRSWSWPVWAMYVVSSAIAAFLLAVVGGLVPPPQPFGAWSGLSMGSLFTLCSIYCIALMMQRGSKHARAATASNERGLQRTMLFLFMTMIPLFFGLTLLQGQRLIAEALQRFALTLPIFFLIASIYFENRFEFYDRIVKRGVTLLASLLVTGLFLTFALSALDQLPGGFVRPWLFAVALLPLAMLLPWLHRSAGYWLDRMWFGREFTPVEAVKQVLSAMHPATDEPSLIAATETRLSDMFHTRVHLLLDEEPAPEGAVVETIGLASQHEGTMPLRIAVIREPGSRPLLSEDVSLMRSLAGVFGYMLENVRLQRRRQEQDQVAQELRLQTSRSELKALRAQINPHFLFNALNAIASLIHTDPTRADAAVEQLAEVFRYTLRRSEQEWAPLDQELAFAQAYLDVEQARFGKRLSFAIEAAAGTVGAQVPAMLLHTLVENAVKHGISQVRGVGRIDVNARLAGDSLILEVSDTGPGPHHQGERASGESFGLRSVRDRLQGHFGARASLTLARDEARGVTTARIELPMVRQSAA